MTPSSKVALISPLHAAALMHAIALAGHGQRFEPITKEELRDAVQGPTKDTYIHDIDPRFQSKRRVKRVKVRKPKTEIDNARISAAEAKRQRKAEKLRRLEGAK